MEGCTVQESFKRKQQTCFQSYLLSISQEITKKNARGVTITNTLYFDFIELPFATRYFQEFSYISSLTSIQNLEVLSLETHLKQRLQL